MVKHEGIIGLDIGQHDIVLKLVGLSIRTSRDVHVVGWSTVRRQRDLELSLTGFVYKVEPLVSIGFDGERSTSCIKGCVRAIGSLPHAIALALSVVHAGASLVALFHCIAHLVINSASFLIAL